jgi:hypothetical protein
VTRADEVFGSRTVIRHKVSFVGVTIRRKTSPNTDRWQQQAAWHRTPPASAVVNVSLDPNVWSYFGNYQVKLTRTLSSDRWTGEAGGPRRDEHTRQALTEAAALVVYGRSSAGRHSVARAIGRDPALSQSWLCALVTNLTTG